jgi:hypothetical protein
VRLSEAFSKYEQSDGDMIAYLVVSACDSASVLRLLFFWDSLLVEKHFAGC